MALEINRNNSVVTVTGKLTSENAVTLEKHFKSFLTEVDEIILNLDDVTYIESGGAFTMEKLYLDFIKSNRIIQIIGKENKPLAEIMKRTKTAYILSDDHV